MKYKIQIAENQEEDFLISAKEPSPLLYKIETLLGEEEKGLFGYAGNDIIKLDSGMVESFFVEGGRVFAMTEKGKLMVKERIFQLEERFFTDFIKINQSCLVNVASIERFETSIGSSLLVVLKSGYRDYVSRRQLKAVKERIGI